MKNFLKILAATSAMALVSSQGLAASATGQAEAVVVAPLTLTHVSSAKMNFGTVAPSPTSASNVTLTAAASAVCSATGGAERIGTTCAADQFNVTGHPSTGYSIVLPTSISLTSGTNSMTITSLVHNKGATPSLSGSGSDTFYVGGQLNLAANQATGTYSSGASYTVTIAY